MDFSNYSLPKVKVPTRSLVVADLKKDKMDGQIAACVLQGIVNRDSEEKIYVYNTKCADNGGNWQEFSKINFPPRPTPPPKPPKGVFPWPPPERPEWKPWKRPDNWPDLQVYIADRWLPELYSDIPQEIITPVNDEDYPVFLALLKRYKDKVKGIIIFDHDLPDATIEAATTIAGQTDGIVVSPELAEKISDYGFEVIEDLRKYSFKSNPECLKFLYENYFANANHAVQFTWSHMDLSPKSWGAANKDYVVANRLFTYYLDIHNRDELQYYDFILSQYPYGTPVLGWTDELVADAYFARLGYFMIPYISVENLTVASSFPSVKLDKPSFEKLPLEKDAVYIAFHVADGDNLLHSLVYEPHTIMTSENFGKVPATWVLNPIMADIAPRALLWHRKKLLEAGQEPAAMLADGYASSEKYEGFKFYCDFVSHYMEAAGMVTMKQMVEGEATAWNVQPEVLLGGYSGHDWRGIAYNEIHLDGNTLHIGSNSLGEEDIEGMIASAKDDEPMFISVFSGTASRDVCTRILDAANSWQEKFPNKKIRFVLSAQIGELYKEWVNSK